MKASQLISDTYNPFQFTPKQLGATYQNEIDSLHDEPHTSECNLGYEPRLFRGLTGLTNFSICFTEVACLVSAVLTFGIGLANGGPAVVFWSFILTSIMIMNVGYCMAEICAAYPAAGAVYNWAGQLSRPESAPLISYITGWSNFVGNAAGDASFAFGFSEIISSTYILMGGSGLNVGAEVALSISILGAWTTMSFVRIDQVGWLNLAAVFAHIGAILIILVALQSMPSELNTWSWVLSTYHNGSGFTNASYVVLSGMTGAFYMFVGYEASAHLAEETSGRANQAPRGIIRTIQATIVGGAMLLLALLFATPPNIVDALGQGTFDTGCVAINILAIAVGKSWAVGMAILIAVNMFFGGLASVAVTGRIAFALARDGALPCSQTLSITHEELQSPVNCLFFIFVIDSFVLLLPLLGDGGQTAFYAIINLSTLGFQVSYLIPILLRQFSNPADFPSTPMSLRNFPKLAGAVAVLWLFGSSLLLFLPYESPITTRNFNWLCVVATIALVAGTLNWLFNSRFSFVGPNRIDIGNREKVRSNVDDSWCMYT